MWFLLKHRVYSHGDYDTESYPDSPTPVINNLTIKKREYLEPGYFIQRQKTVYTKRKKIIKGETWENYKTDIEWEELPESSKDWIGHTTEEVASNLSVNAPKAIKHTFDTLKEEWFIEIETLQELVDLLVDGSIDISTISSNTGDKIHTMTITE